uniref:Uncharacterized protein n=1 Tax=Panagrolaimus superbus TaxID=310955 RepID=A0A914XWA8_9BILA
MLNTWRNEMQISDPPMESFDEEWHPPQPEPKICEIMPKGGKAATIMDRAFCPWQWRQNYDESREPKVIAEAFCLCKHARANSPAYCIPIRHEVAVLRRSHCDPITRLYHYTKSTHTITIGCHSVFARTARASPLSNHYRIAPLEI